MVGNSFPTPILDYHQELVSQPVRETNTSTRLSILSTYPSRRLEVDERAARFITLDCPTGIGRRHRLEQGKDPPKSAIPQQRASEPAGLKCMSHIHTTGGTNLSLTPPFGHQSTRSNPPSHQPSNHLNRQTTLAKRERAGFCWNIDCLTSSRIYLALHL